MFLLSFLVSENWTNQLVITSTTDGKGCSDQVQSPPSSHQASTCHSAANGHGKLPKLSKPSLHPEIANLHIYKRNEWKCGIRSWIEIEFIQRELVWVPSLECTEPIQMQNRRTAYAQVHMLLCGCMQSAVTLKIRLQSTIKLSWHKQRQLPKEISCSFPCLLSPVFTQNADSYHKGRPSSLKWNLTIIR